MGRKINFCVVILAIAMGLFMTLVYENTESTLWHAMLSVPPTNMMFRKRLFEMNDIPDMKGKYVIVTGGYAGIGKETTRALAEVGAYVIVAGRNETKGKQAMAEIQKEAHKNKKMTMEFMEIDLESLASVREFVRKYKEKNYPLHVLINNAGVMGTPYGLTGDGIERIFAGNHVGHFLLATELIPVLEKSAPSRVVILSSLAHTWSPPTAFYPSLEEINDEKRYNPPVAYGQAKVANLLFAEEMSRRVSKGVYVNAAHPGGVVSELARHIVNDVEAALGSVVAKIFDYVYSCALYSGPDGALTTLYLATSPEVVAKDIRGKYYQPIATPAIPVARGRNATLAKELWTLTEDIIRKADILAAKKKVTKQAEKKAQAHPEEKKVVEDAQKAKRAEEVAKNAVKDAQNAVKDTIENAAE